MSKPLEKLIPYIGDDMAVTNLLLNRLNAAIDRINELEARYEGHTHPHNHNGDVNYGTPPTPTEASHER